MVTLLGLIYLKNPRRERPPPEAVILVKVHKASDPPDTANIVLAALIPLATQRLPLQFQFPQTKTDDPSLATQDLLVQAGICMPDQVNRTTKSCGTALLSGTGVAKALQFTTSAGDSSVVNLRAGVSIALE